MLSPFHLVQPTYILYIYIYISYNYIYIYIICIYLYLYLYIYMYIFRSSYRKLAWVGFEPTTSGFRSEALTLFLSMYLLSLHFLNLCSDTTNLHYYYLTLFTRFLPWFIQVPTNQNINHITRYRVTVEKCNANVIIQAMEY